MAKVLIGVVTHGKKRYCLDQLVQTLRGQNVPADLLFVVNNGESAYATLLRSMNMKVVEDPKPATTINEKNFNGHAYLREYFLRNGYDYLFFVDSDVMIPKQGLQLLLELNTDIACGAFLSAFNINGKTVIAPVFFKDLGNGECQLYTYEGTVVPKVMEIGAASLGCTLVTRKVLEAVPFRTFGKNQTGGEDMAFFVDARAKGFKAFAHTGIKCLHTPYPLSDPRAKLFQWKRGASMDYELKLD
ncbi:glycosyltransferase family 2 protein [Candidatus Woesearchaeota archaeon]|nr:glycosyltransferase family 2 protein [Candidatus Woesearchaeota archaeon]